MHLIKKKERKTIEKGEIVPRRDFIFITLFFIPSAIIHVYACPFVCIIRVYDREYSTKPFLVNFNILTFNKYICDTYVLSLTILGCFCFFYPCKCYGERLVRGIDHLYQFTTLIQVWEAMTLKNNIDKLKLP